MKSVYMTALSPLMGGEGDLKRFQISCSVNFGWHSPFPLMIPHRLWTASFPRDRVDRKGLKELPPLRLSGPVRVGDRMVLTMDDAQRFDPSHMFREIHGKSVPPEERESFIDWEGVLLSPCSGENISKTVEFTFRSWQLGLYKIRYDAGREWWEDMSWTSLWKVRRPG